MIILKNSNQETKKKKYKYIFLITIIVLGIISGIVLSNILSYNDKKIITNQINDYFINLRNGEELNYLSNLLNSLKINFIYYFLLLIFSVSIIGIILNPFILYFKSVIVGFTIGILINIYKYSGIILGIFSIFPNQLINLLVYMTMSFYGIILSIKLFKLLFFKEQFNINIFRKKYLKIIGIGAILLIISSLYETFLGDLILKLFTFLIK